MNRFSELELVPTPKRFESVEYSNLRYDRLADALVGRLQVVLLREARHESRGWPLDRARAIVIKEKMHPGFSVKAKEFSDYREHIVDGFVDSGTPENLAQEIFQQAFNDAIDPSVRNFDPEFMIDNAGRWAEIHTAHQEALEKLDADTRAGKVVVGQSVAIEHP